MGEIAIARNQIIMLAKETTRGTLTFPSTGGSAIETIGAGNAEINQNPNFTDSDEGRNTRDVISRFSDARPAGTWTIPTYMRPSGTAGTAPQDDLLYESFFGKKSVVTNTSVTYTQAIEKPSFSIWLQQDHTLFFASGATVSTLKPTITNQGGVKQEWSGGFMYMGWVGSDIVTAGQSAGATQIKVSDTKRFCVGGRVYNKTKNDDNSGAGYEITAIDSGTSKITIDTGISVAWELNDEVTPFLPARVTVGDPLQNSLTTVDVGSDTGKKLQSLDFTLNDPVSYIEDEISQQGYPTAYLEDVRDYSGELNMYFRKNDLRYFYDAYHGTSTNVTVHFGTTAGSKATLTFPYASIEVPQISINAPAVNIAIKVKALGSSGEDSANLVFT